MEVDEARDRDERPEGPSAVARGQAHHPDASPRPRVAKASPSDRHENVTIEERQNAVVRDFDGLADGMEKYRYLIDLARRMPPMPEEYRTDASVLRGCTVPAWLRCRMEDGKIFYQADSPSLIVRGLAALLIFVLSGHTPDAIRAADLTFIGRIGLKSQISPSRSNGLFAMLQRMRSFAAENATRRGEP